MARPQVELITALRTSADRLSQGAKYSWSHQGACNCGHLAQTVTNLSRAEIHKRALQKAGDWGEHTVDYCPTSGHPIDHVIASMLEIGMTLDDLAHLEKLSDRNVLRRLPPEQRNLDHRKREDVVLYMRTLAALLEAQYLENAPAVDVTSLKMTDGTAADTPSTSAANSTSVHGRRKAELVSV